VLCPGTAAIENVAGIQFHISLQNVDLIDNFIGPKKNAYRIEIPKQLFKASYHHDRHEKDDFKAFVHIDEDVFSAGSIKVNENDGITFDYPVGQVF
jgi:hypothetical protein